MTTKGTFASSSVFHGPPLLETGYILNRRQAAALEAAARPDVSELAMIALYPKLEEANAISSYGRVPAATIHVTMVFLGEVANIDMKAAARAVGSASGSTKPLQGKIGGIGVFAAGEDGYPQIAIPNVQGLVALRALLTEKLAEEGIVSPSEHDWVPHTTVSYLKLPILPDHGLLGLPLTFEQLSLVVADERKDFPLDPEGASDDVHRPDPKKRSAVASRSFTRAEIRHREILISQVRGMV